MGVVCKKEVENLSTVKFLTNRVTVNNFLGFGGRRCNELEIDPWFDFRSKNKKEKSGEKSKENNGEKSDDKGKEKTKNKSKNKDKNGNKHEKSLGSLFSVFQNLGGDKVSPPKTTKKPDKPVKPVYIIKPTKKPSKNPVTYANSEKPPKKPMKNEKPTKKPSKTQGTYTNPFPSHDGQCPWRKKNSQDGDCGKKFKNRCSLKYFRICGEDFFNYIYDDVCRWQDALQAEI